ncbi:helix-turn-helix domain-containing protein [Nostoc sp. NIES-2111]
MTQFTFPELRAIPLFSELDDAAAERVAASVMINSFPPKTVLYRQNARGRFLYAILSGEVEFGATQGGAASTVLLGTPGFLFPLPSVLSDTPSLLSAKTLRRSRLAMMPDEALRRWMTDYPCVARGIIDCLAGTTKVLMADLLEARFSTSLERFARWLLRQTLPNGPDSQTIQLSLQRRQIAALLGMSPESLSRSIAVLQKHGVKFDGQTVTITSIAELETQAPYRRLLDDGDQERWMKGLALGSEAMQRL